MEKTFTIVGVSTQGKVTKFRVCNGDKEARIKVLERNGCTDINLIDLPQPMTKLEAITAYKAQFPESEGIRMPNEKADTEPKTKTVNIKKGGKTADAAAELLNAIEEA